MSGRQGATGTAQALDRGASKGKRRDKKDSAHETLTDPSLASQAATGYKPLGAVLLLISPFACFWLLRFAATIGIVNPEIIHHIQIHARAILFP